MTLPRDPGDAPDSNENPMPANPGAYPPPPGPVGYNPPGPDGGMPPSAPMGYAPPPVAPKRKSRLGTFVLLGIVAVAVILFVLFRDRLPNDVNSLAVGECFDEPSVTTSITQVQSQPCNVAHDDEVFFLVTDPGSGVYPGVEHFRELARTQCLPAASAYLGTDFNSRSDIEAGYLYPTSDSWSSGDRGLTCYLYRVDEEPLNASLKNIGTAPLP